MFHFILNDCFRHVVLRSGGFVIRPHCVSAFAMRQDIFILVVSHIVTVTSISPFPPQ